MSLYGKEENGFVYPQTDIGLWLEFYTSAVSVYCLYTHTNTKSNRSWPETQHICTTFSPRESLNNEHNNNPADVCRWKELNKKPTRRQSGEMKGGTRKAGSWNLAHLQAWRGSQSCAMLRRPKDGQSTTSEVVSALTHIFSPVGTRVNSYPPTPFILW